MPYKPKFCCQCGTPIERSKWTLLTSRRFCDLCETDYKAEILISRVVIMTAFLFGIFGIGTLLRKPDKPLTLVSANSTTVNKSAINTQTSVNANVQTFAKTQESNVVAVQTPAKLLDASP
jgi:NMD protein affecting ribosome stability and mRNA decay